MRRGEFRARASFALFALLPLLALRGLADEASAAPEDRAVRAAELARNGDFAGAIPLWRALADGYEKAGRPREREEALLQLAEAQQALGRYGDSLAPLAEAQSALGAQASAAELAAIHGALASAYLALGPSVRARDELTQALTFARSADAPALVAALLNNRGNLASGAGAYLEAARDHAESAEIAERAGEIELAARALANQARALITAARPGEDARAALVRCGALATELPASHDTAYLLLNAARSYARLAEAEDAPASRAVTDIAEAHRLLRRAESMAESIGDERALSYALGYLGALYESQARTEEALALTRRALFVAQQANAPEALYRWHWQIGRLLRAQGDSAQAISAYRQAVAVLATIRFELAQSNASGEGSFREAVGPVYLELVDLLLLTAPAGAAGDAQLQARLSEVRETLELQKAAELRDYFRDECVDQLSAKVEQLDQVSRSAVVIYPVVLPDRLELLLTWPGGLRRVTVPVARDVLTAEARQLRALLEKRTTREYLPHAQRLYDWLIRPFAAELAVLPIDTLVFVPDGALRTIPMSALHDGEHFLIERYALATSPGLSLTDPRPLDREHLAVLSSGLSQSVQGFGSLEHVPDELAAIHTLFGGEELLDEKFRVAGVEAALAERDYGVVHIATHAQFSADPDASFLLTYDGRITLRQLAATVARTRFRDRPIELLTLSACETAQGDERAALGLAGVAIQAGARSALGTLWSVNDEAATRLVTAFYRDLKQGPVSKAIALQRAQRKLIADENSRHPFYWSAFLLINNWL